MGTSKVLQKNNLENLESTSEFSRVLVTFTQSMLNSTSSLLQQHWFKSICFPLAFILGLFANLFMAINFIQIDLLINLIIFLLPTNEKSAENILTVMEEKIFISQQNYKKIMLQFKYFNNDDQDANKNWKNYEDFY
ncbi:hypothetical protein [Rickettsiella endosymbiont of Miltochrista miniata]|uniref:hypothetical protein n=1 Tax=Rickettsiella endosymbiont of Miltochrista miniata TaxID=3066239 RepID=UPI00313BAD88